jgi:hypothetical protein
MTTILGSCAPLAFFRFALALFTNRFCELNRSATWMATFLRRTMHLLLSPYLDSLTPYRTLK